MCPLDDSIRGSPGGGRSQSNEKNVRKGTFNNVEHNFNMLTLPSDGSEVA